MRPFCKILKMISGKSVLSYLSLSKITSNNQRAFLKQKSALLQRTTSYHDWHESRNNGSQISGVYIDLTKARRMGGVPLTWLEIFLYREISR